MNNFQGKVHLMSYLALLFPGPQYLAYRRHLLMRVPNSHFWPYYYPSCLWHKVS